VLAQARGVCDGGRLHPEVAHCRVVHAHPTVRSASHRVLKPDPVPSRPSRCVGTASLLRSDDDLTRACPDGWTAERVDTQTCVAPEAYTGPCARVSRHVCLGYSPTTIHPRMHTRLTLTPHARKRYGRASRSARLADGCRWNTNWRGYA
jgi:hypothetical protein